jgi:hypothetical protein
LVLTAFILIPVLLTASCAAPPVTWEKPGIGNDQWVRDKVACQYKARREAEKCFRQRGGDAFTTGFDTDTLSRDLSRYDAKRDERRLFESCLAARGYNKKKAAPREK